MSKFYVFFANGFEEIEAIAPVDILRRAGAEVVTTSIDQPVVNGAHGLQVCHPNDLTALNITPDDWIVLPGGMPGASNLRGCAWLTEKLLTHAAEGGHIAAICASPAVVLASIGLLRGVNAVCYPGFEPQMLEGGANVVDAGVVVDNNITTAAGPGYAIDFGLSIVEQAFGEAVADKVAADMLLQ